MKTKALSLLLLAVFIATGSRAFAYNEFECLRDLLPVTTHGATQGKRSGVEPPFMLDDRHMIFPAVEKKKLVGFYVYDKSGAYFYDSVINNDAVGSISGLHKKTMFQLVAQPSGLETITIHYVPGYTAGRSSAQGPVMLGLTVLPVVGAFVSRPQREDLAYENPAPQGRMPASNEATANLPRKILKLATKRQRTEGDRYRPLRQELALRQAWVSSHNLDDATFKAYQKILETSCKEN